jgi:hypothetical protein
VTNVVVFSGGRGATSILTSLSRTRDVQLSVVINAYDSGLSTGRVRRAFEGMLGPSDVRKAAGTLTRAVGERSMQSLADFLEIRLGTDSGAVSKSPPEEQLSAILDERFDQLGPVMGQRLQALTLETWSRLRESLTSFQKHLASAGYTFDYDDLALGNAVLAGLYVDRGFNGAMAAYQDLLGLREQRVLNATQGEDRWLSASAGDYVCPDEGVLVSEQTPARISDLYLLDRADHDRLLGDHASWWRDPAVLRELQRCEMLPRVNDEVAAAVAEADVSHSWPGRGRGCQSSG